MQYSTLQAHELRPWLTIKNWPARNPYSPGKQLLCPSISRRIHNRWSQSCQFTNSHSDTRAHRRQLPRRTQSSHQRTSCMCQRGSQSSAQIKAHWPVICALQRGQHHPTPTPRATDYSISTLDCHTLHTPKYAWSSPHWIGQHWVYGILPEDT